MLSKGDKFRVFEVITGGRLSNHESVEHKGYSVQATLFPVDHERSVIFVPLPGVSEEDFVSVLSATKPVYVVDMRPVPRFDIGQLNRQAVFEFFRQEQSTYIDQGEFGQEETRLSASALLKHNARGPVMFLVSGLRDYGKLQEAIFDELDCSNGAWHVYEVPPSSAGRMELCAAGV